MSTSYAGPREDQDQVFSVAQRDVIPFRRRPVDIVVVAFFALNLGFITYVVDLEQLVISDPNHFRYPLWPPPPLVDLVHWWGRNYDPLLMARPAFWRMTIWIDVLVFGPFYVVAIYAFVRGREWIRPWALVWCGLMLANVSVILLEEYDGIHATPHWPVVLAANVPWFVLPLLVIARLVPVGAPLHASASH